MVIDSTTLDRAADTLRTWALDEDMKAKVMASPTLAPMATKVARRFIAGESIDDALTLLADSTRRGHRGSIECVGESVRDTSLAEYETEQFIELLPGALPARTTWPRSPSICATSARSFPPNSDSPT